MEAADCATFPSRVAIHHGVDLPQQTQLELMQALKFDCRSDPAASPVLEGLSPAQQVIVLQQARIWLNSEEQVVLDRAIQQITTGENNTITQDEDS